MLRIVHKDERWLPFPPSLVYEQLVDLSSYNSWWPSKHTIHAHQTVTKVGAKADVIIAPFIEVGWEITDLKTNQAIHINYYKGMHSGTGVWKLKPNNKGTLLSYEIDIYPNNFFYTIAYQLVNARQLHSKDFMAAICSLEKYLLVKYPTSQVKSSIANNVM